VTIKRALGERAALLSTLLLAWMPWHVMISRWALDANLLPFFLLLGTYTVSRALDEQTPFWTVVSLLPWGLGLYAYAVGYFVVPAMLVLVILFYREVLIRNWRNWLLAFLLFGFLTLPIALFLFKNFIVKDLNLERLGVLGIPLLPFSRLAQISSPIPDRWVSNLFFVVSGFQDSEAVNTISGIPLIFMVVLPLTLVGSFYLIRRYRQSKVANLFLLWLAACLPVFLPWKLTSTHVNAIYIPMLAVAAFGFFELRKVIRSATSRKVLAAGVSVLVALHGLIFAMDYFFVYPRQPETELAFYRGFDRAIAKSLEVAKPADSILVTDRILLPYIMVAFYSAYPPDRFHREVYYTVGGDAIEVASLGRFYFGMDHLPDANAPFTYVLAKWDEDPCPNPQSFLETRLWKVGRCN
jgi:4-amino-4-deoxy-L-arabinose transferase-like glycosyltransferase